MDGKRKRRRSTLPVWLIAVVGVIVAAAILVITAASSELNKARMYAQEQAALKAVQTLNAAQVQYKSTFGRFATSLTELGPPASGTASASAADLIEGDLASGEKWGYRFRLTGTPGGYSMSAVPVAFGSTGSRSFFSDQSLVIRQNYGPK
jgi:type IV pilus assembly protein PilA